MLHGVRLLNGKASYVNRYVRTKRFQAEAELGRAEFLKIGDLRGLSGLLRILIQKIKHKLNLLPYTVWKDFELDRGTANTALVYHDRRLLALVESSFPYHVKILLDGMLETQGAYSYGGKLNHPFTAHPKVDFNTGEMMFFGYKLESPPFLTYSVVNKKGDLIRSTPIELPEPVMIHDMAITTNYSIFMDLPLVFRPKNIVKGGAFVFDPKKPARIGVIPRHAGSKSDVKWFNISPCYVFHTANAWEDGDEITLIACRMQTFHLDAGVTGDSKLHEEKKPYLYQWKINLKNHSVSEKKLFDLCAEFPTIHPALYGKPTRYVYCALFPSPADEQEKSNVGVANAIGVVKFDLAEGRVVKQLLWGPNSVAGECVFVPSNRAGESKEKEEAESDSKFKEDDGYLLTFITDLSTNTSSFGVLNATTMSKQFVATVPLPQRVPSGFHGIFVSEAQLKAQTFLQNQADDPTSVDGEKHQREESEGEEDGE